MDFSRIQSLFSYLETSQNRIWPPMADFEFLAAKLGLCMISFIASDESTITVLKLIFKTDMIGHSIMDFVHRDDFPELMTTQIDKSDEEYVTKRTMLRIKSVITPRGRNLNLKSAMYKVSLHCISSE